MSVCDVEWHGADAVKEIPLLLSPASHETTVALLALPSELVPSSNSASLASAALLVQRTLLERHMVQCAVVAFKNRLWVRIAPHIYNSKADYEALAIAVKTIVLQGGYTSLAMGGAAGEGPAACEVYRSNGPVKMYVYIAKQQDQGDADSSNQGSSSGGDAIAEARARYQARAGTGTGTGTCTGADKDGMSGGGSVGVAGLSDDVGGDAVAEIDPYDPVATKLALLQKPPPTPIVNGREIPIPAELAYMLGPLAATGIVLDLTESRELPHGTTQVRVMRVVPFTYQTASGWNQDCTIDAVHGTKAKARPCVAAGMCVLWMCGRGSRFRSHPSLHPSLLFPSSVRSILLSRACSLSPLLRMH